MRFILGLIAGALTTMLVATTLDTPNAELMQTVQDRWQRVSQIGATPMGPIDDTVGHKPAPPPVATEQTAEVVEVFEVGEVLTGPNRLPPPLDVTFESAPHTSGQDLTVLEPAAPNNSQEAAVSSEVVVWSPFHSEASAAGFANRLTRQLSHPFAVRKLGPANYVVFYTYADAAEQQVIEQRIAEVTGVSRL